MVRTIRSTTVFKDAAFPLACFRLVDHDDTDIHGHDFHELVVILAGRGHHILDGERYRLSAGDVFVVRGGMQHGYTRSERVTLVNILYQPRRLGLPLQALRDLPGYHALFRIEPRLSPGERFKSRFRLAPADLAAAAAMVNRLEQELRLEQPGYRFVACAQLMQLIGFLSRRYSLAPGVGERPVLRMGEVLSYIENHYRDPVTVRQLMRIAHMSESSLLRAFQHVLGRSPIEHVIHVRIQRAAELLQQGGMRVTDVAFACGFNDSNYFSRQFRRLLGRSPSEYRPTRAAPRTPMWK